MKLRGSFQSKQREIILRAEENKTVGNPLSKDVKDAKSWVQKELDKHMEEIGWRVN